MRMMRVLLAGQCWPELCSSCGYYPCRLRLSALLWRMGWRTAIGPLSTGKAGVRIEPARADKVTVFISMAECYHLYSWRVSRSRHVHSRLCLILVSSSPAVCLQWRQEATCCSISLLHCRTIWLWGGGSESSLVTAAQSDLQSHSGRCNHMRGPSSPLLPRWVCTTGWPAGDPHTVRDILAAPGALTGEVLGREERLLSGWGRHQDVSVADGELLPCSDWPADTVFSLQSLQGHDMSLANCYLTFIISMFPSVILLTQLG